MFTGMFDSDFESRSLNAWPQTFKQFAFVLQLPVKLQKKGFIDWKSKESKLSSVNSLELGAYLGDLHTQVSLL